MRVLPSRKLARVVPAPAVSRPARAQRFIEHSAALILALLSAPAAAQVSGNVALLSDYRYRGVSLTSGKPAAQLGLTYDDPQGWYAGGSLSAVLARCWEQCGGLQGIAYAGYATQLASGLTLDGGGDYRFGAADNDYHFGEAYVGLVYRDSSARVHYAPHYYGQSFNAAYAELNQSFPLGNAARLLAHVGWLRTGPGPYRIPSATRTDVLLGGSIDVQSFELQLSWQHATALATAYPAYANERRSAWVFVVSRAF